MTASQAPSPVASTLPHASPALPTLTIRSRARRLAPFARFKPMPCSPVCVLIASHCLTLCWSRRFDVLPTVSVQCGLPERRSDDQPKLLRRDHRARPACFGRHSLSALKATSPSSSELKFSGPPGMCQNNRTCASNRVAWNDNPLCVLCSFCSLSHVVLMQAGRVTSWRGQCIGNSLFASSCSSRFVASQRARVRMALTFSARWC